jgi:nitrite reductase/ring-hydroxylating ferredoxin subunit
LVLGAAALAAPVLSSLGCGAGAGQTPSGNISAGAASALAVGTIRVVPPYALAVGRDSSGVYAMELICTHEGCDLSGAIGASSIVCPCHEATYDFGGNVLQGPARVALTHYKVTVDTAGALTINADLTVPAGARVPV